MITVLIVEDSSVVRDFLRHILSADPEIQVIGTASDGAAALDVVQHQKPDVITMDIYMPRMNGLEATRKIMETHPTPIVIVSSSVVADEVATTFRAIEAGALAAVPRPQGLGHSEHEATAQELVQTVKLMSEVKVVRRWPRPRSGSRVPAAQRADMPRASTAIQVVAIGASTGGPLVLQTLLSGLPKDFPVPVLIVQHMAAGFIPGFAEWLAQSTGFPVHVAAVDDYLLPGHAYVAPDGAHMRVGMGRRIVLSQDAPKNGVRPSVSYLFQSVAHVFGCYAAGLLLTGMGKDGAEELKLLRDKGAVTMVQDRDSAVVYGMPGEAIKLDAATYVLSPERMVAGLVRLADKKGTTL
ncbi:MAG: chemotaxis-specific protein-glutamate methyltransferase CheB [Candidatus Entotheonellia bacterium]